MRILKLAVVMIEHLLIMTSTQGVMISTSSYQQTNAFDGELLDEFPTASLVKCLKTCDADRPECQAARYNIDSGKCHRLVEARGGTQVTWLSGGSWTLFQKVCVHGWSKVHQSCYQIIHNVTGRQGASDGCKSLGGYLTVISDAQEKAAIQGFQASLGYTTELMYIDGSDAATEDVWVTGAGRVMTYTGFDGGEPNGGTIQNCLVVRPSVLADYICGAILSAICEM